MHNQNALYQLGGFNSPINWYRNRKGRDFTATEKTLAQAVAGQSSPLRLRRTSDAGVDEPVELLLGMRRSGTSCLLLTSDQVQRVADALHLPYPRQGVGYEDFESVSPILFDGPEQLERVLVSYRPKAVKKGSGRQVTDNGPANRYYLSGTSVYRSAFEHQRLFVRIMKSQIDLVKFGLREAPWKRNVRVYSLVMHAWSFDTRSRAERTQKPKLLDMGWAQASVPELSPEHEPVHVVLNQNSTMKIHGLKAHKQTLTLDPVALRYKLQESFGDTSHSADRPIVLLVVNEAVTRGALRSLGLDISLWESGIKSLLWPDRRENKSEPRPRPNDPRLQRTTDPRMPPRPYDRRSRSRSPPRRDQWSSSSSRYNDDFSSNRSRARSPPPPPRYPYAPVYIVDVRELYGGLSQKAANDIGSIANMAKELGLPEVEDDMQQLINIWRCMAEGEPIDRQKEQKFPFAVVRESLPTVGTSVTTEDQAEEGEEGEGAESDEERDPNDIVQTTLSTTTTAMAAAAATAAYDADDFSDYGDDDDD